MTESTTEHETEPVVLDKAGADAAATDSGTAELETVEAGTTDAAAGSEDGETARPGGTPGRKRGRRARRAAAAARADQDADEAGTSESASEDGKAETGTGAPALAGAKSARAGKSDKLTGSDRLAKSGKSDRPAKAKSSKGGKPGKAAVAATASGPKLDGRRLARVITALLVLAILLAVLLLIQLIKGPGNGGKLEAREDRREAARQAADTVIPKLYSYDYRQIDANTAEQVQLTTGSISDQIRTDTAPALKQLAPKTKAVVQAVSLGSAVLDDSGQDVQVLVYLNQAVSSNLLPAPRLDRNRVVATMRLVDGQWKVAEIKAL